MVGGLPMRGGWVVRWSHAERWQTSTTRMITLIILVVQWSCRSLSLSFSRG